MEHVAVILTSFLAFASTSLTAWFVYNQRTKDKMTDIKIEQIRHENSERTQQSNRHIAIIYGELWSLINTLDADRCFILQPHPEKKHLYLSVFYEVGKKGISMAKEIIQDIPINECAWFAKEIATNKWLYYDNIDGQVQCVRIKSLMKLSGSTNIAIKQMVNIKNEWIGSLVLENTSQRPLDERSKEYMRSITSTIQFIIPPVN